MKIFKRVKRWWARRARRRADWRFTEEWKRFEAEMIPEMQEMSLRLMANRPEFPRLEGSTGVLLPGKSVVITRELVDGKLVQKITHVE